MTVGDQIGRIVGAPAGSTVMHQNVAIAEAVVLSCFRPIDGAEPDRLRARRTSRASATSTRRATTSRSSSARTTAAILDAIDERTLLVPISHVLFKSGEIQDVEPIVRRAHEVGAHVVLDAYQSRGRRAARRDGARASTSRSAAPSSGCCGGPGNGWLYVRPDLAEGLEPTVTGWQAHAQPFAFEEEMRVRGRHGALPHRHPERARALRGNGRLRPHRGGRRRADPRELAAADRAPDRPGGRGRLRGAEPARPGAPGRHRHRARAGVPGRPQGAGRARSHLRLPARRGHPARAALLQRATTSSGRRSPRSPTSSGRARTAGTPARSRATDD